MRALHKNISKTRSPIMSQREAAIRYLAIFSPLIDTKALLYKCGNGNQTDNRLSKQELNPRQRAIIKALCQAREKHCTNH